MMMMPIYILLSTKNYETTYIGVFKTHAEAMKCAIQCNLVDEDGHRQFEIHLDELDLTGDK